MSEITYRDGRFWDGARPYFVIASEYMYYRERRAHWIDRLAKLRSAGVNVITFYIPWRHHLRLEEGRRTYDFTGRTKDSRDVVGFMRTIESFGLRMIIKPGPFVHSELNVGGLPDLVCPSFNPAMPPARRHHGRPAVWSYDNSQLPAPLDEGFDALVREWLLAVREVILPFTRRGGPAIALQLNDETIYCTSNDPPWHIGYEHSGMRFFQQLLEDRYGDIDNYNRLHATDYTAFEFVPAPKLTEANVPSTERSALRRREELLAYVDWAEYQWRLRRDVYVRHAKYLDIDLPYLTNYAGITPPIVENVPDLKEGAQEPIPADYARLYPEWWFAMNRVDSDADAYEYGMISWLGVAAYDRDVFARYINTARRARGLNMEENWGFGTLYDHRSRYPIVPFFQTLASLAGGATGYDIFVGVGTDYWDDSLDRITKLQCATFPSHAPIDEHGNCRPMYHTAAMLSRWFRANGEALLSCEPEVDVAYLLYAPYAAVSSWIPDRRNWALAEYDIPRCGREGFEEFSASLQEAGYMPGLFELEAATPRQLHAPRAVAIHSAFFMDEASQTKLVDFLAAGGRLFISGELPEVDLVWRPCTLLRERIESLARDQSVQVVYRRENLFADGRFAQRLAETGFAPRVRHSTDLRAFVHRGAGELFVFFFNFDVDDSHDKWIECHGQRIELRLGSKTSGILRIREGRLIAYLVKGENEVEGIRSTVRIQVGPDVIEREGDFSSGDSTDSS